MWSRNQRRWFMLAWRHWYWWVGESPSHSISHVRALMKLELIKEMRYPRGARGMYSEEHKDEEV